MALPWNSLAHPFRFAHLKADDDFICKSPKEDTGMDARFACLQISQVFMFITAFSAKISSLQEQDEPNYGKC